MKSSEPSPENQRSSVQLRENAPAERAIERRKEDERREGDFHPQYLDLPHHRPPTAGGRNLVVGVLCILAATLMLGQAAYLAGPRAVLPLGVALLTAVTLYVLARARIFRQRNGGFVAFGVVCLLGVLVPLLEYAWTRDREEKQVATSTVQAGGEKPVVTSGPEPQSLKEAFALPDPLPETPAFRVLQDLRVEIDGKPYILRKGDVFAVGQANGADVRFSAGDEQIALPLTMVEMLSPEAPGSGGDAAPRSAPASPAAVAADPSASAPRNPTEEAQREAIRRYPALGVKGSPENLLYIDTYQELKHTGADDFFRDPQWPLALAELLAKRERWNQPPRKRRPVAEELDDPEPEPSAPGEMPETGDPELPQ